MMVIKNDWGAKPSPAGSMLRGLEGLQTRYVCGGCEQTLLHSNNFARDEMDVLLRNLTGSCPNCRHVLSFAPQYIRFLLLSA